MRFIEPSTTSSREEDAQKSIDNCFFKVCCTSLKDESHVITVCKLTHNCSSRIHNWRGSTHKSIRLGETMAQKMIKNIKTPVKELMSGFQDDYKRITNYKQIWREKLCRRVESCFTKVFLELYLGRLVTQPETKPCFEAGDTHHFPDTFLDKHCQIH